MSQSCSTEILSIIWIFITITHVVLEYSKTSTLLIQIVEHKDNNNANNVVEQSGGLNST